MKAVLELPLNTPIIAIWEDSSFTSGWQYPPYNRVQRPVANVTIGFLTENNADFLEISSSVIAEAGNGGRLNPLVLPWGSVRRVEALRLPRGVSSLLAESGLSPA